MLSQMRAHMQNPGNQVGVVYPLTKGVIYSYEAQRLDVLKAKWLFKVKMHCLFTLGKC